MSAFKDMNNIKIVFVGMLFLLLPAITLWSAAASASVSKSRYLRAVECFESAEKAEQNAKFSFYPTAIANYYEVAVKNYKLALKEAQRSAEESEQLSKREKYHRKGIINDSRQKIEICQVRYNQAVANLDSGELMYKAYKFVVAGFNCAVDDNKESAKINWDKAVGLYERALTYTNEEPEREIIKSKIKEIVRYMEKYL